jgi:hypothetical protein
MRKQQMRLDLGIEARLDELHLSFPESTRIDLFKRYARLLARAAKKTVKEKNDINNEYKLEDCT